MIHILAGFVNNVAKVKFNARQFWNYPVEVFSSKCREKIICLHLI